MDCQETVQNATIRENLVISPFFWWKAILDDLTSTVELYTLPVAVVAGFQKKRNKKEKYKHISFKKCSLVGFHIALCRAVRPT